MKKWFIEGFKSEDCLVLVESEGCVEESRSLTSEKAETMVSWCKTMPGLDCTFGNC